MAESNSQLIKPNTFALTHGRPSLNDRLRESVPIVLVGLSYILLIALVVPSVVVMALNFGLGSSIIIGSLFIFVVCFAMGLGGVMTLRYTSRKMLGGRHRALSDLEQRISSGQSSDLLRDMDLLITENLNRGRPAAAEFYSKQLLAVSERLVEEGKALPVPDMLQSTSCWISTPPYHKSLRYFTIWLFEQSGTLNLGPDFLEFESRRICFRTKLSDIRDICVYSHPWWLKPMPMHYISITFEDECGLNTFYLSPFFMRSDTVWDINEQVKAWYSKITAALQQRC